MMKRFLAALTAVGLAVMMALPVMAAEDHPARVVDDADLLTDSEEQALEQKLDSISTSHNMDVIVVTVEGTDGKSPMAYADDFFDYKGYGMGSNNSGILLLISMEDRDYWMSTCGNAILTFTDAGMEYMESLYVPSLSSGDYYEAFVIYADQCDAFMTKAENGSPYDTGNLPRGKFPAVKYIIAALVVGFVISGIINLIVRSKNKSVRANNLAADYVVPGSMRVTEARDMFLYRKVNRVHKESSSSGGGSSTHRSSSGVSHGGHGGKF